jgi:hypothetical protein
MNARTFSIGTAMLAGCAMSSQNLGDFAEGGAGTSDASDATPPPTFGDGGDAGSVSPACAAAAAAKGTVGCDFVQATPSFPLSQACWAVFLANGSQDAATVTVARAGTSYDATTFGRIAVAGQPEVTWPAVPATGIPPGKVAVLFMSSDPSPPFAPCPVPDAINAATDIPSAAGTTTANGIGDAWHIVTSEPVTAYDIYPYGGASSHLPSAELLVPTTAWGTNAVAVVPPRGDQCVQWWGPQFGQIVAAFDDTTVQVTPSNGALGGPAGRTMTIPLHAGQYVQWQDSNEMSGSILSANKPFSFNGGSTGDCYHSATSLGGGCDTAHQSIPAVTALGSEYVVAPYTTRRKDLMPESIPYRFVGMVANTALTYDPPVSGAPATLGVGAVADFETTLAFTVTSQDSSHPFYVAQVMSGCIVTGGSRPGDSPDADPPGGSQGSLSCFPDAGFMHFDSCLGDEEFTNLLPSAQFVSSYLFFTDMTYGTTNLVFVREAGASGFQDVTLDCVGTLSGWQAIGTTDKYEMTNVDLVRAGQPNGTCVNGPHSATSASPFGLMVWGLDYFASYAYPAGGNAAALNSVTVTQ